VLWYFLICVKNLWCCAFLVSFEFKDWCTIFPFFCVHPSTITLWSHASVIWNPNAKICFANLCYLHFNFQTSLFTINHNHRIAARGAKSILSLRRSFSPASARSMECGEMEIFQYRLTSTNACTHNIGIASAHNVHTADSVCVLKCTCSQLHFYKYSEQRRSALGRSSI
jgi:hypothetical protein